MKAAGVDIRKLKTVVFNSGGDAMTACSAGTWTRWQRAVDPAAALKAGKVRMLAVVAPQRLAGELAGIPTWKELGINVTFGYGAGWRDRKA